MGEFLNFCEGPVIITNSYFGGNTFFITLTSGKQIFVDIRKPCSLTQTLTKVPPSIGQNIAAITVNNILLNQISVFSFKMTDQMLLHQKFSQQMAAPSRESLLKETTRLKRPPGVRFTNFLSKVVNSLQCLSILPTSPFTVNAVSKQSYF